MQKHFASKKANTMYRFLMRLVKLHAAAGKSGYLENPRGSMLWLTPGIKKLLRLSGFKLHTDMCQHGCLWKKRTSFLIWNASVELPLCKPLNHRCSATLKRHLELTGKSGSKLLTRAAQVYPRKLASALAPQLCSPKPAPPTCAPAVGNGS